MSDSYQAIYDAVRSRIHGDVGQAMEAALREAFGNSSHHIQCVAQEWAAAAFEHQRPSAVFRPRVFQDGDKWCALYGEDLQNGVSAFGDSPDLAARAFDAAWTQPATPTGGATP